jgi:hypothetical protein
VHVDVGALKPFSGHNSDVIALKLSSDSVPFIVMNKTPTSSIEINDEPVEKDLFFDPFARPFTKRAQEAANVFFDHFIKTESQFNPRKRSRKAIDKEILEEQLGCIFANLVSSQLRKKPKAIAISLSKQELGRKSTPRILNDTLSEVLETLSKDFAEALALTKGSHESGKRSTIEPLPFIAELIQAHQLRKNDFNTKERQPVILRARKTPDQKRKGKPGKELELPDTPEVRALQDQINQINAFLKQQNINYVGDRPEIDEERLTIYRVFNNGRLDKGGRLYGGFWQQLSGDEREEDILINGEHVVGPDYGQMAVSILYALEGIQMPLQDAYELKGWEDYRDGVKTYINKLLHDDTGTPKAKKSDFIGCKYKKVETITEALRTDVFEQHKPIAHHFNGSTSGRLFYEESKLLVHVLLKLQKKGICALPVHDSLYVNIDMATETIKTMKSAFKELLGGNIEVC